MTPGFNPVRFTHACFAMLDHVARANARLMRIGLQTLSDVNPLLRPQKPLHGDLSAPVALRVSDPASLARLAPPAQQVTPKAAAIAQDMTDPVVSVMPDPVHDAGPRPVTAPARPSTARRQPRRAPSLPPDLPPGAPAKPPKPDRRD